jgi:nucleotide-binding universal stress UspA family protein
MLNVVLVAVDSSELSLQVVNTLGLLNLEDDCRIVLLHVMPNHEESGDQPLDIPQPEEEFEEFHDTQEWLDALAEELPFEKVDLEIVQGDIAEEVIRYANIHKADLIVIGSRGLMGVARVIMGSVSSQVVGDAPCSVFVVKGPKI